ncbi:MAG TPA: serine/threonine-protein kinase, partial [Candidatus Saccharimonadales bacterium]|nr:serine/threonine-protein kinase [Candidatus Saccharimonadales bacterium]
MRNPPPDRVHSRLMPLQSGEHLGSYEIRAPLGAGGMGEVYRAIDPDLGREVAIKILPPVLAADPERLMRFDREARVLASLNHPNIATLFGFEKREKVQYLVMELVEGETLAGRLREGLLPREDLLDVFRQIAEGLEAAHESGVIHRDLKPANIKITPEGKVKLLDFGLAKALEGDGGVASDATMSPTLTAMATQRGEVMGTASYMSPEQARGKPVDRRTDIWAFGCVLYESLTGRLAFGGETISDTISLILQREPDLSLLPADTPPRILDLLQRCFEKNPRKRLRDIGEARLQIERV